MTTTTYILTLYLSSPTPPPLPTILLSLDPDHTPVSTRQLSPLVHESVFTSTLALTKTQTRALETPALALILRPAPAQRIPALAVFDMDSTLIQNETIDLLAAHRGCGAQIAQITERAMNGDLDFYQSLRERVGLLAGLEPSVWESLKREVTITRGARDLMACLRKLGVATAVVSGGFVPLAAWLGAELGMGSVFANRLGVDAQGRLTGELEDGAEVVTAERKREVLLRMQGEAGGGWVLAVGDGANDLPMLGEAGKGGLGVAVNAKPRVQELAPARLNTRSLLDLVYLFGVTEDEVREMVGR